MDNRDDASATTLELIEYRENPSPQTLRPLMNRGPDHLRRSLIEAHREKPHWRIAQHLALAWANKFGDVTLAPDFTRAAYFAHVSCQLSSEHPLARFARATIYWERRLTYLVLDDASHASENLHQLNDHAQAQSLLAQLNSLRICALAYDGRVNAAIELCEEMASQAIGPTNEAILQCFISTRPIEPELHHRAAMLSASRAHLLGQRPMELLIRALRAALLRTIAAKCLNND
jgi:hypothetical protein